MYKVTLDQFSGPLDLLLQLIEKEELDISRISLAKVTDKFLEYLDKFEENISEIADFLYLAAKLIYIKSTILLPFISPEEEEEILSFEKKLQIYKEFQEAFKNIKKVLSQKNILFSREKFFLTGRFFVPPRNVSVKKISEIFKEIVKDLEKEYLIVKKIRKRNISLAQKIKEIKEILSKQKKINFLSFIKKTKMKIEIVMSFLALLELVKREIIKIRQGKIFGEIRVFRIKRGI